MSAGPGWYPDPGGQRGRFRYWDGHTWSAQTTANPAASLSPAQPPARRPGRGSRAGWWVAGVVALVVLTIVGVFAIRTVARQVVSPTAEPSSSSTATLCPDASEQTAGPQPEGGARVRSGRLSYPRLPAPFSSPKWDSRVPFGRDVQSQDATVETATNGGPSWVAGVLIARLLAGDGFYGPKQGATVVAECITAKFYGDSEVHRGDKKNKALTIDGHDAWIIESHLTFDVPDVRTKGELMIVVVVDVGDGEGGLFYASIPDTSPQFEQPARDALAGLEVSG